MTNIFLSVFEISISVSPVVVSLILLTPFLNKRYAVKWKCGIWMFLALRLLIPYSGIGGASIVHMLSQIKAQVTLDTEKNYEDTLPEEEVPARRIIVEIPAQMTTPIVMQSEQNNGGISFLDIVACVWGIGCLSFISVHFISYLRYKNQVVKRGKIIKDTDVLHQMFELRRELHIKSTVRVMESHEAGSPMIIGFVKPVLVLPKEQYSPEELFFILKHELVHLKHNDAYMKLLFVAANAVHWFNPIIWIMHKEAVIDMELSCDERVTQGADYAVRKAYTETLLSTIHKEYAKKNVLSAQFYGGKQIMKKRFRNILTKTGKKNGVVILLCAIALTVSMGTLVSCSVVKGYAEDDSVVTDEWEPVTEIVSGVSNENEMEDMASTEDRAVENTMMLTIMKEGEPEEKQAALVVGDGYSIYLPNDEWQKDEENMWHAVVNEEVKLWVTDFESGYDITQALADEGYESEPYESENAKLTKQEEGIVYKVRWYEAENKIWCIFYCYPSEAEEGWGRELPVIADTFAVTVSENDGQIYGYISGFGNDSVTIDQQIWATVGSEYWKPEYDADVGFEVVDVQSEDITCPILQDCKYFVLENHYNPIIELSKEEFESYLSEIEYPVLWIIELEEGQVKSIMEQYRP